MELHSRKIGRFERQKVVASLSRNLCMGSPITLRLIHRLECVTSRNDDIIKLWHITERDRYAVLPWKNTGNSTWIRLATTADIRKIKFFGAIISIILRA